MPDQTTPVDPVHAPNALIGVHDALAGLAADVDPGPEALDVPDTPDDITGRDPSPRPGDGPQDVNQYPIPQEG